MSACIRSLRYLITLSSLALLPLPGSAQVWRSTLYPESWTPPTRADGLDFLTDTFLQDYSYAGYRGGDRPLPEVAGPVFDVVVDFGADASGFSDATAAIQNAINAAAAAGGGVVYLPAGTFQLSLPANATACLTIRHSQIILRGAGPGLTFLHNTTTDMRGHRVIQVREPRGGSWINSAGPAVPITRDETGPTRTLQLESVADFSTGDQIVVYNPVTPDFVNDLNMGPGADGVNWLDSMDAVRGPRNLRRIESIDTAARTITLDAPTRWQLRTRDAASVYLAPPSLSEVGLEHFSIGNTRHPGTGWAESDYTNPAKAAYQTHDSYLIELAGLTDGWVQNVKTYNPGNANGAHMLSNGLTLNWCRHVTIRQTTMARAQYGGGGGNGYGIRLNSANECLVLECETGWVRHGYVFWRTENSGNVVSGCYDHDSGTQQGDGTPAQTAGAGSDHHGIFSHSNLLDNNRVERSRLEAAYRGNSGSNPAHGTSSSQSVFWNTTGLVYLRNERAIVHSQQAGPGYIIGTQGPASDVDLDEKRPDSAERTNPIDTTEGIGQSATLFPQSLYLDQLQRRLGTRAAWLTGPAAILRQPANQSVSPGSAVDFIVEVREPGAVTYQWLKNGDELPGATTATLSLASVSAVTAGDYQVRIRTTATEALTLSATARLTVAAPPSSQLANGSVLSVLNATTPLTIGFSLAGGNRALLVRGIGPSLDRFVNSAVLADPDLTVFRAGAPLERNVDWANDPRLAAASAEVGAFPLDSALDAAVAREVTPGTYTSVVSANGADQGLALVEIYARPATAALAGELTNFSTLRRIDDLNPSLTAGFVITGNAPKRMLIRAVGPSLAPYVSAAFLVDPTLTLNRLDAGTAAVVAENDDWQADSAWTDAEAFGGEIGAFALQRAAADAALLLVLSPGAYTAVLTRKGGARGLGLVEIYAVP